MLRCKVYDSISILLSVVGGNVRRPQCAERHYLGTTAPSHDGYPDRHHPLLQRPSLGQLGQGRSGHTLSLYLFCQSS